MSFLTHFFASNSQLAEELARDEPLLRQSLQRYFDALRAKQDAIGSIKQGKPFKELLPVFRLALADEYLIVKSSEMTEKEIMDEARAFHSDRHTEELKKLTLTMNHAASQERYMYHLMEQLYTLLTKQATTLAALESNPDDKVLQETFVAQISAEQQVADELCKIKSVRSIYQDLAFGERRKHELQGEEEIVAEEVFERMLDYEIVENGKMRPVNQDATAWLTAHCFNKLEDEVIEQVNNGTLDQHPHVMYEFVNSDLFERFVLREINVNNLQAMNDKNLIRLFLTIFRDLYNTRIERELLA